MGIQIKEAQEGQGQERQGQERQVQQAGVTGRARTIEDVAAQWEMVLCDFQDVEMPYKIETNAAGWVVMEPPPADRHRFFQKRIERFLDESLQSGEAIIEVGLHTHGGTKIPDVVWASYETWEKRRKDLATAPPPRICVEVLSPSNTDAEMEEKRRLYLDIGVEEVWICDPQGHVQVFGLSGPMRESALVPDIPDPMDAISSGKIRPCIR